jgi:FAD:protein FMN transferase
VDRAVEILKENGISSALVSAGTSSIYTLGAPPGEKSWKISLRDPFDQNKAAEVVYLKNFSLSTSGNYERFFKMGGRILLPHQGSAHGDAR